MGILITTTTSRLPWRATDARLHRSDGKIITSGNPDQVTNDRWPREYLGENFRL